MYILYIYNTYGVDMLFEYLLYQSTHKETSVSGANLSFSKNVADLVGEDFSRPSPFHR